MAAGVGDLRPADSHLALPPAERLRVNEIFHSIQGESTFAGRPCGFSLSEGKDFLCALV